MPALPPSNTVEDIDAEIDPIIQDFGGSSLGPAPITFSTNVSVPMTGSQRTPSTQRIGQLSDRLTESVRTYEDAGTGGVKVNGVTLLGEGRRISDFDSHREGKNVKNMTHFARMNVPMLSVNREFFLTRKNQINHVAGMNNFGIPKLFKSFDNVRRVAIPFEDFPGRLDPVRYVEAGDYILQYMILTDLTKDIDKFVNPDDLNGAIEVFEVRESFANTSISDIRVKGIKASMTNENFYATGQGAAPIENRYEIKQASNSFFEDAQDILYDGVTFGPKLGFNAVGSFALESPVPDETRFMSPFKESSEDKKIKYALRLRNFAGEVGIPLSAGPGALTGSNFGELKVEDQIPEMGTRYRSSNSGFIMSPNYIIIAPDRFINPGTDSIAFSGMNKS